MWPMSVSDTWTMHDMAADAVIALGCLATSGVSQRIYTTGCGSSSNKHARGSLITCMAVLGG